MFNIYLREDSFIVKQKTVTHDPVQAVKEFERLINLELDGSPVCAVINKAGTTIAVHDFRQTAPQDAGCKETRYWRGRTQKLDLQSNAPIY